jgi:transglutaminase-like putative cysteine protease
MRVASMGRAVDHLLALTHPYESRGAARPAIVRAIEDRIRAWHALQIEPSHAGEEAKIDPVALVNAMKRAGLTEGEPLWQSYVASGRRMVQDLEREVPSSARFRVRWRRTVAGQYRVRATRGVARVRLPLAVRDRQPEPPVVRHASHPVLETREGRGGLDVFLSAPDGDDIAIEIEAMVHAHRVDGQEAVDLTPEERALWTQPREGLVRVTPRVQALAASLVEAGPSPLQFIDAAWRLFFTRMRLGYLHHHELSDADPLGVLLEGGWFDCYAGGALLVALCRARGLPARVLRGIALHPVAPFCHYWVEVYMHGGWRPFDLMAWDLAAGQLEDESWSRRFYGRLEPRTVLECYPRAYTGAPGFRAPSAWVAVMAITAEGSLQTFLDARGETVWSDALSVECLGG